MSLVVNSAGGGDPAPPVGPAGGDLTGNYPAPQIAPGVITDADVNAANIDGLVGVPSLRTLGTGGQQAAQGSHTHSVADASATVKGVTKLSVAAASPTAPIAVGDNDVRVTADQVVAQASIRTIGTGGQQAAAGNHTHSATFPDASTSVKGVVTLSAAPASPTSPIAVGDNDTRMTNSRAPSGAAGGSLAGTYPNPTIAAGAVTVTELASSAVTAAKIDGTLKPTGSAAAGTEALRALGTTASTAAAGNDSRLNDSRAPSGAAGGSLAGTYPNPTIAAAAITATEIAGSLKPSGSAAAGTEALRALGTSSSTAAAGNDSRLSDSRAPNGTAGGSLAGSYPNPTIASGVSLPGSPTTTTQSSGDNSTKVATTAYADAAAASGASYPGAGTLVFDEPLSATIANYTQDTETNGTFALAGGGLRFSNAADSAVKKTTPSYTDFKTIVKVTPGAGVNDPGITFKRVDGNNLMLAVWAAASLGGSSTLSIYRKSSGTFTALATSGSVLQPITPFWLTVRQVGNAIRADGWAIDPRCGDVTPFVTIGWILTATDATIFGAGVASTSVGLRINNANTTVFNDHIMMALSLPRNGF